MSGPPSRAPPPPPVATSADVEPQRLPAAEASDLKKADRCQICEEKFQYGQSFAVPSPFRKSVTGGRMKHMCRVCTRVVCQLSGGEGGCSRVEKVPASMWTRSLGALRKPDLSAECDVCDTAISTCSCAEGWVCKECSIYIKALMIDYIPVRDSLEAQLLVGNPDGLEALLAKDSVRWLSRMECDDGDDVARLTALGDRLKRAQAYFGQGEKPVWVRPAAKERNFSKQVAKTALKGAEEVLNVAAWGNLRLGFKAVKMAAKGYKISEQITHYILSDEFLQAWNVLLVQLGEFAERESKMNQKAHSHSHTKKAMQAVELCKRFYYFTQHLLLNRICHCDPPPSNANPCTQDQLSSTLEYLPLISMLYKTNKGGQPSIDKHAEAAWFLDHVVGEKMLLLDYVSQSGEDTRVRSRTKGAKHPAFALFVNEADRHVILAVRGTQDKNDHLMDLDLADCQLSDSDPAGVHRGMLNGASYILDEWGLRPFLRTAPRNFGIRLVGHSLGAGIVTMIGALLVQDEEFKGRDLKVTGFGMPACVSPELSERLQSFVTAVVHREDAVPRLSFTNLVKLSEDFNREEEREWCKKQLSEDVACVWEYLGFSRKEGQQEDEEGDTSSVAASGAGDEDGLHQGEVSPPRIARDLVAAGTILHLKQDPQTGEYSALSTDHTDPELCRILVTDKCIQDHYMDSYIRVLRGLNLRKRIIPPSDGGFLGSSSPAVTHHHHTRKLCQAVDSEGAFRPCSVCDRDVCDVFILKSDAARASATVHCQQCGLICCVECAPAADSVPDFNKELGATRKLSDHRLVLPSLGTLELQRVCIRCQMSADPC